MMPKVMPVILTKVSRGLPGYLLREVSGDGLLNLCLIVARQEVEVADSCLECGVGLFLR